MNRRSPAAVLAVAALLAIACGGDADMSNDTSMSGNGTPGENDAQVYFDQPEDGATVTSPVEAVFGSENVTIAAVPEEFEVPRDGVVHYHLGFNAECLPPGTVIPQADPWIHFGDGSNQIDLEVPEPGPYRLTVQAGDDEHRTIEGLCETIDVTVQ